MAQAAFAGAVGSENHRQGGKTDFARVLPSFEVLNL
jgi:hypothetical protein